MQAFSFSGDRSQIVANHNRIKPSRRICQMDTFVPQLGTIPASTLKSMTA